MITDHESGKDNKVDAKYTASGTKQEHCGHVAGWGRAKCKFYLGANKCSKVAGFIVPEGWCRHWQVNKINE